MGKFKKLFESKPYSKHYQFFNVKDLINLKFHDNELERRCDSFMWYYLQKDEEEKGYDILLDIVNKVLAVVYQRAKFYKFKYISINHTVIDILRGMLLSDKFKWEEMFPVSIYVSAKEKDEMTIGLLLHKNGKLEMFEGNEEASKETILMVNKALNPNPKYVEIYGSHSQKVITYIQQNKKLPKDLYITPNKEHAAGYWGEDRILFKGIVDIRDIGQESYVDWKTLDNINIKNFQILN